MNNMSNIRSGNSAPSPAAANNPSATSRPMNTGIAVAPPPATGSAVSPLFTTPDDMSVAPEADAPYLSRQVEERRDREARTDLNRRAYVALDAGQYATMSPAELHEHFFPGGVASEAAAEAFHALPAEVQARIIQQWVDRAMRTPDASDNLEVMGLVKDLLAQWSGPVAAVFTDELKTALAAMSDAATQLPPASRAAQAVIDKYEAGESLGVAEVDLLIANSASLPPELKARLLKDLTTTGSRDQQLRMYTSIASEGEYNAVVAALGGPGGAPAGAAYLHQHFGGIPMSWSGRPSADPLWVKARQVDVELADALSAAEIREAASPPVQTGSGATIGGTPGSSWASAQARAGQSPTKTGGRPDVADLLLLTTNAVDPEQELLRFEMGDPDFMQQLADNPEQLERIKAKLSKRNMLRDTLVALNDDVNNRRKKLAESFRV